MKHAQEIAQKQVQAGQQELYIKELIGPRGGLPTLKKDLVRLATLLHQPVDPTDKIKVLKEKIRGPLATVVSTMKNRDSRSRAAKDAAMMPSSPTPPKVSPAIPMTTASASSHGADSAKLMELEAKLQQTIENQDIKFKDMLTQMMVFFQTTSQSIQGQPEAWTLPKEANHGPMQMDSEDVFDQAARQMGITRDQAIELNAIHLRDLAEAQMSKAPNGM